jgi:hypothetical protein
VSEGLTIPHLGTVPRPVAFGVVGLGAAFVGWRYYVARQSAAADDTTTPTENPDFDAEGDPSSVLGAVSPTNSYGLTEGDTDDDTNTVDGYGFTGTTNSEWTQYVTTQLEQSDTWSYSDIVAALGQYLANGPLTTLQKQIVQSGIALGGFAPVGSHTIISQPVTRPTQAPTGLHVVSKTSSGVTIGYSAVAGATQYVVYRSKVAKGAKPTTVGGVNAGESPTTQIPVGGLSPSSYYAFAVRAMSADGSHGPESTPIVVETDAAPKKK